MISTGRRKVILILSDHLVERPRVIALGASVPDLILDSDNEKNV